MFVLFHVAAKFEKLEDVPPPEDRNDLLFVLHWKQGEAQAQLWSSSSPSCDVM